jgi:hypothetical protein
VERGVAKLFRSKAKITGSVKFTQVGFEAQSFLTAQLFEG